MFSHPDYDGHEALLFTKDAASGLRALIAIHDTTLGPAFGGCRMYPYASEQHAMTDVLRLSRGMTYKAAICELPYGGGKSVMIADPRRDKTPALLHAMGRIIEGLGGRYITADDVGTTLADLIIMREVTRHTAGATAAAQQALPATPFGVFEALRAAAEVCLGRSDLEGLRVAVQGLGNVGMPLCGYLSAAGAALVVSDLDGNRCAQAAATYGATLAAPEEIHAQHVDVFVPAALGAVLNDATIPGLRAASSAAVPTTSLRRRGTTRRWRYAASCSCRTIWRMPAALSTSTRKPSRTSPPRCSLRSPASAPSRAACCAAPPRPAPPR